MSRTTKHTVAIAAALALLAPLLNTDAGAEAPTRPLVTPRCSAANIQRIRTAFPIHVDEIRVVVASNSPASGAADIRVADGEFDRVLHIRGPISKRLTFFPALTSSVFDVTLDPVFTAKRGACIDRVELMRNGHAVATVKP